MRPGAARARVAPQGVKALTCPLLLQQRFALVPPTALIGKDSPALLSPRLQAYPLNSGLCPGPAPLSLLR